MPPFVLRYSPNLCCISAGIPRSPSPSPSPCSFGRKLGARMMSAMSSSVNSSYESLSSPSSSGLPSRMSPWLMLPPAYEDGDMVYKFYNLAEEKVECFNKRGVAGGGGIELPDDDDSVLVGSSHGWLALFNQRNNRVFLSNPLSGCHIKLPSIHTLPNPQVNLRDGRGTVSKVILSCSPDEDDCRAMMSFGPGDSLAFCLPRRSTEWTPIGDLFFREYEERNPNISYGRAYEDFVYCSRRKLFSCITQFRFDPEDCRIYYPSEMEDWDLCDPVSPKARICYWLPIMKFGGQKCSWLKENRKILQSCIQIPYLVYAEQYNQQFIVIRFVYVGTKAKDPINGGLVDIYPYKTIGFTALKIDYQNGLVHGLRLVEGGGNSFDGLAMFIGMNHSFAVPAAELGLKPNSIYITDANKHFARAGPDDHDIGIFDYENKIVSPCAYYPCDDHQSSTGIVSPPMWFTPSRY